ncbi:MAG: ATP synthase F1 subunit gamma [Sulfobacillus benefaciens]|uniref:ATP synthase gamma chain n=1 Tax=Sulfobacillus benefaciens TaxID=453960 RepID=A0A2T2XID0_9FIRM|nr:MAG: ATP synthase F1 subunit gamma [Sulfobacillus benefaciens]
MAGGLQELNRRIKSVRNTQQITRAMKMVAAAKLRRAEERARQSRDYFREIRAITSRAASRSTRGHALLDQRPPLRAAMLVVTSARGLAGPHNTNVLRQAMVELQHIATKEKFIFAVGRKGRDFFRRRGYPIMEEFLGVGDDPSYRQARAIAEVVIARFLAKEVDEVYLTYTEYVNAMTQHPKTIRILPVEPMGISNQASGVQGSFAVAAAGAASSARLVETTSPPPPGETQGYVFEPDTSTVFEDLLPRYIEVLIYGALLESKASEQGARMTAMDSASKNAEELIRRMILMRNRLRQAAITREIAELVGGAEALE